jgi:hypothetical protein
MTMVSDSAITLTDQFEARSIEPAAFGHVDHVAVALEMLGRYPFVEACSRYAETIKAMAEGVGAPEKFNATITIAFMSLIAERRERSATKDLIAFLDESPELLDRNLLKQWYSNERLHSTLARRQFLLPDIIGKQ